MTALDQFDRLETLGLWHARAQDVAQEVIVKFGKSTLVIEARPDEPLAHWSLAALHRVSDTDQSVVFKVDRDADESLTIEDRTMRDAIDRVLASNQSAPPAPPKRRGFVWLFWCLVFVAVLLSALFFGLNRVIFTLISPEQANRIATEMVPRIEERTGPACNNEAGVRALAVIAARLSTDHPVTLRVIDLGERHVIGLPGHNAILNRATVENARSEAELAGWAALALSEPRPTTALTGLFDDGVSGDALQFLASGTVSDSAYERGVNRLLISQSTIGAPSASRLSEILVAADIPASPLSAALRRENLALQFTGSQNPEQPVLTDAQWVALQQICD